MMRRRCFFDDLPVELMHLTFGYLWAHQICEAFVNLSEYVDRVLAGYDRYLVNFRSVSKRQFDQTCRFLRPAQVRSLLLTDVDDTPNQCQLFFSKISIEEFVNLRALAMNSFDEKNFDWLDKLCRLKHFSSLQIPGRISHSIRWQSTIESVLLPRLDRLVLDDHLFDIPLFRLRHLKLLRCHSSEIITLFSLVPHLQSLDITLVNYIPSQWPRGTISLLDLRRLSLQVQGEMNMDDVRTILSTTPRLKTLEMELQCDRELIDGRNWEPIVAHLSRFDFRFRFCPRLGNGLLPANVLGSFRSSFWLDRKRWCVALRREVYTEIFTMPRFAPTEIGWPGGRSIVESTTPQFNANHFVETVEFSSVNGKAGMPLSLLDKPRVSSLILMDALAFNCFEQHVPYEQIRTVRFPPTIPYVYSIDPKIFSAIFPRLESLTIRVHSRDEIRQWIDQLPHLLFAHFFLNFAASTGSLCCWLGKRSVTRRWLMKNTQRLKRNVTFQCAINDQNIRLWMSEKHKSTSSLKRILIEKRLH